MTAAALPTTDAHAIWLEDRRKVISGTDVAKILRVSPFGAPIDVYLDKIGEAKPFEPTEQMEAGKRFEHSILEWYGDRCEVPVRRADSHGLVRSPVYERIGATLDGYRCDQKPEPPVEVKNIGWPGPEWGQPDTDEVPIYYAMQGIMQMHVTDAPFVDFAACFTGNRLGIYRMHRDHAVEQEIIERSLEFWDKHIATRTPPPIDGSPSYSDYLGQKFKKATEEIFAASSAEHDHALALIDLNAQIEALELERDRRKNVLKDVIGERRTCVGSDWKATWYNVKGKRSVNYAGALEVLCKKFDVNDKEKAELIAAHEAFGEGYRAFKFTHKE